MNQNSFDWLGGVVQVAENPPDSHEVLSLNSSNTKKTSKQKNTPHHIRYGSVLENIEEGAMNRNN
jgi:hypothetical protein